MNDAKSCAACASCAFGVSVPRPCCCRNALAARRMLFAAAVLSSAPPVAAAVTPALAPAHSRAIHSRHPARETITTASPPRRFSVVEWFDHPLRAQRQGQHRLQVTGEGPLDLTYVPVSHME